MNAGQDAAPPAVVTVPFSSPRRVQAAYAMRRARSRAGLEASEFAQRLEQVVGPPITVVDVVAWEDGREVPPFDIALAAAEDIAGVEIEILLARQPLRARLERLERFARLA